jgi:superfamily I DNA and/or RNA helicase
VILSDAVSRNFYAGRLLTGESRLFTAAVAAATDADAALRPIVWRTHRGSESPVENSFSTVNVEEARIICHETAVLAADPRNTGKGIVIITFYKAQVRELEQRLREEGVAEWGATVTVMTVDSAQGSEADIVIISCVRSNEERRIGHAGNMRRINVALSRAKERLIIVGDARCFQRHGVWRDLWQSPKVYKLQHERGWGV